MLAEISESAPKLAEYTKNYDFTTVGGRRTVNNTIGDASTSFERLDSNQQAPLTNMNSSFNQYSSQKRSAVADAAARQPSANSSLSVASISSNSSSGLSISSTDASTKGMHVNKCERDEASFWISEVEIAKKRRAQCTLALLTAVTFAFVCAQLVGGYLAHSLAIMSDAFHMLSDAFSFIVSIVAIQMSRRPPTTRHPYGFHRAEVLGALISVLTIWVLTGLLVYMAARRIIEGDLDVDTTTMLVTAVASVFFNVVIGLLLFFSESFGGHAHAHGHSHFGAGNAHQNQHHDHTNSSFVAEEECSTKDQIAHAYLPDALTLGESKNAPPADVCHAAPKSANKSDSTKRTHRQRSNLNIRAAFVHALGDLVQSVGVFIAALIIHYTGFRLADPICTFFFSVLVLLTTLPVMKEVMNVLMEAAPLNVNIEKIYTDLMHLKDIVGVHNLRVWSLKSDVAAISLHVEISPNNGALDADKIVQRTQKFLRDAHGFVYVTVQTQC